MKVTIKLFSGLAEYLPGEHSNNTVEITAPSATPHSLLAQLQVPRAEAQTLMVNGAFVPPNKRDEPLQDGDVMTVWPAIQGG